MDAYQQNLTPIAVKNGKIGKERLPCDGCRGFYDARRLSKHKCFLKGVNDTFSNSVKSARAFLALNAFDGKYQEVHEKIISGIKNIDLQLLIRNDSLLLALAAVELDHKEKARYHDIRYTLRVMAKVLIEFRAITNENMSVIDLVQPENYDDLLRTMKNLAEYRGRTKIGNPHLVMKIGFSLRTLIILARLMYTKSLAYDSVKKMKLMMTLYKDDYSSYSNNAKVLYELRRGNAPEELPLESDLKKFREYCITEIERLIEQDDISNPQDYRQLNTTSFTRLLTFNARRGGEPGKLTLDHWKDTLNDTWKRRSDIERLTDPVEIKLAERMKLCYLPGKKKKKGMSFNLISIFHQGVSYFVVFLPRHRRSINLHFNIFAHK